MYSLIVRALKALGFSLGTGGAGIDAASITSGTIDAARLPSYVDDVVEYANLAAFPGSGTTGKIYVALDTGIQYRWTGSAYVDIAALKFNVAGDTLTGTAGAGYLGAVPQSSKPSTPASGFRLFANAAGKLAWIGTNGFLRVFDGTANTADRTYTLPDRDGEVVVNVETKATLTSSGGAATLSFAAANKRSEITLTENTTLGFSNFPSTGYVEKELLVIQHASAAKTLAITGATGRTANIAYVADTTTGSRELLIIKGFSDSTIEVSATGRQV